MGGSYYLLLFTLLTYYLSDVQGNIGTGGIAGVAGAPGQAVRIKWHKKGIYCSDSPHQIVSFIWLEQLNEWNLFLADSDCVYKLTM